MISSKRIILTLIFGLTTALLAWYGIGPIMNKGDALEANEVNEARKSSSMVPDKIGAATVLQPAKTLTAFSLLDTQNNTFTQQSLKGHWTLLFFGYSQCPEICPKTLAIVSDLFRAKPHSSAQAKAQFVFVSLDPKSDGIPQLKTFLSRFHPDFIGVTGDEAEVIKLAKDCRIYSWKDPEINAAGQKIIDHSGTILLVNPEGKLQALFSPPHASDTLAKELKVLMSR